MIFENYLADFYDFYYQFSSNAIIHITDYKEFNIKFIIYPLKILKKLNNELLIFYENKLYFI